MTTTVSIIETGAEARRRRMAYNGGDDVSTFSDDFPMEWEDNEVAPDGKERDTNTLSWGDIDDFPGDNESEEEENEAMPQMIVFARIQEIQLRFKRRDERLEVLGRSDDSFLKTALSVADCSIQAAQLFMQIDEDYVRGVQVEQ